MCQIKCSKSVAAQTHVVATPETERASVASWDSNLDPCEQLLYLIAFYTEFQTYVRHLRPLKAHLPQNSPQVKILTG